jgi:hypothetical protein
MTTATTTQTATVAEVKLPARQSAKDAQGRSYVKTQRVGGAAITVHDFTTASDGKSWSAAVYDVILIDGQPPALRTISNAIRLTGTKLTVGDQRAKNLTAAVRLALGSPQSGDVVTSRRGRARVTSSTVPATADAASLAASTAVRQASRNRRASGAEATTTSLAADLQASIDAQAAQNRRPSQGGGSEVARRPRTAAPRSTRQPTAKQQRAAAAKAAREAALAAADTTTAAIDAALSDQPQG